MSDLSRRLDRVSNALSEAERRLTDIEAKEVTAERVAALETQVATLMQRLDALVTRA